MDRRVQVAANACLGLLLIACGSSSAFAQTKEGVLAGTYLDPAIQRPNILPYHILRSIPEHRQVYNRPTYFGGKIAHIIEPTSQEAMSWETNYKNGNYRNHAGRCVPLYLYPKPWEVINTRSRPGDPESMIDETAYTPPASETVSPSPNKKPVPRNSSEGLPPIQPRTPSTSSK
jgi:hypothetical protein